PDVRGPRHAERIRTFVATHAHEPLAGAARVHREREFLVILGDRERARVRPRAAARMRTPRRGEGVDDLPAVPRGDRLDVALPPAALTVGPRLRDAVVAKSLLDERDQAADPLDHQVVQVPPLVLHLLA